MGVEIDANAVQVALSLWFMGFVSFLVVLYILSTSSPSLQKRPWIPTIFRRDGCLMPLYPLAWIWPALLWPLLLLGYLLWVVAQTLRKGLLKMGAQTCCGIALEKNQQQDIEMGGSITRQEQANTTNGNTYPAPPQRVLIRSMPVANRTSRLTDDEESGLSVIPLSPPHYWNESASDRRVT